MIEEKRRRLSWLLAEGAAIVASVLLAFAIQAWWDERRELEHEVRLLTAVADEMRINLATLARNRAFHQAVLSADTSVLRLAGKPWDSVPIEYADSLIADVSWWNGPNSWVTGSVGALTASGRLTSIHDESLRRLLVKWPQIVETGRASEEQERLYFLDVFMPFMRQHGSLPQISDAIRARPGSGERFNIGKLDHSPSRTDHRKILVSPEFQNIVLQNRWIQDDILFFYSDFESTMQQIQDGVLAELDRRGVKRKEVVMEPDGR